MAAYFVADGATQQQQRRHDQRVALHHPLGFRRGRSHRLLKNGKGDIHHGPIDERHGGAEDAGRQDPSLHSPTSGCHRRLNQIPRLVWPSVLGSNTTKLSHG